MQQNLEDLLSHPISDDVKCTFQNEITNSTAAACTVSVPVDSVDENNVFEGQYSEETHGDENTQGNVFIEATDKKVENDKKKFSTFEIHTHPFSGK